MSFSQNKKAYWLGLLLLFMLALLPRLDEPSSRYMLWYDRSLNFWEALRAGNLQGTYQQYHPGVTTMWAAGLGIEAYRLSNGLNADQIPSALLSGPQGATARAGGRVISLVIAGCIVLAYAILARLSGWPVAITAGILLALDPYYITLSKMIHVDALLATFMLVSVLAWLSYLKLRTKGYLALTGLFAGLALLTKSPSLFLAPYIVLTAVMDLITGRDRLVDGQSDRVRRSQIWQTILAIAITGLIAVFTILLLWPALWERPLEVISNYISGIALETAQHETPQFLAGHITGVNPGPLLYPMFLAWKTTLVSLPGLILAIILLIRQRNSNEDNRTWWYLLLYAGGFLLIMTVGAQKKGRYILPTLLAIDVMAAWGLVELARLIGGTRRFKDREWFSAAIVSGILLIQGVVVIGHKPYYGTHHNLLLGGSRVAREMIMLGNQGEGLVQAADFLNSKHNAEEFTVAVQDPDLLNFRSNFVGDVVHFWHTDPDYVLFYVNYVQRGGFDAQWLDLWDRCRQGDALWTKSFSGVPYVWICPAYPHKLDEFAIDQQSDIHLGDHIRLAGYTLSSSGLVPGGTLNVTLYWQSDGQLPVDNHVFVHLTDDYSDLIAQEDGVPVDGRRPTWTWRDSEIIQDTYAINIPETMDAGEYALLVGMYDYGTKERLPTLDSDGRRLADDRIPIAVYQLSQE